jgi:hypothetical protein
MEPPKIKRKLAAILYADTTDFGLVNLSADVNTPNIFREAIAFKWAKHAHQHASAK